MTWEIKRTETFSKEFKKREKDGKFVKALESKLERLRENPENVGGYLSGRLHGYKSTRIIGKYRLVFKIIKEENAIHLMAVDHRKFGYERFEFD